MMSFAIAPDPTAPIRYAARLKPAKSGLAASKSSTVPPAMTMRSFFHAMALVPLTHASRKRMPRIASSAPSFCESSGREVEVSATMSPLPAASATPFTPRITSFTTSLPGNDVISQRAPRAAAAADSTGVPPRSCNCASRLSSRSYPCTLKPLCSS